MATYPWLCLTFIVASWKLFLSILEQIDFQKLSGSTSIYGSNMSGEILLICDHYTMKKGTKKLLTHRIKKTVRENKLKHWRKYRIRGKQWEKDGDKKGNYVFVYGCLTCLFWRSVIWWKKLRNCEILCDKKEKSKMTHDLWMALEWLGWLQVAPSLYGGPMVEGPFYYVRESFRVGLNVRP